jgi:hypothetical protein
MEGSGAEYLVIFNDGQLRDAQIREHLRKARPRAHRLSWPRLTWLAELLFSARNRSESSGPFSSELLVPHGQQALFGSTD